VAQASPGVDNVITLLVLLEPFLFALGYCWVLGCLWISFSSVRQSEKRRARAHLRRIRHLRDSYPWTGGRGTGDGNVGPTNDGATLGAARRLGEP
jgi:hypothetical protein